MKKIFLACLLLFPLVVQPAETRFDDPVKQARYEKLIDQLRCLVCQNQTIADSHADLARDLRDRVAEQIAAGKSDAEIIDWLTARYGDFVLYKPPMQANTILLWSGPFLLLAIGGGILFVTLRRRARLPEEDPPKEGEKLS